MLKRAADVEDKTVSAFVLDKGLEAAAETLTDRCSFPLNAKQYDAFVAALDAAPKPRPRLETVVRRTQRSRVTGFGSIEKLRREHLLDRFDCGKEELNCFLKAACPKQPVVRTVRQTYVLADELIVTGYYSLAGRSRDA